MTITVIGGGASGLMAALTAAENGHKVFLLERQARVGRKLLATGNGRCNLTNMNLSAANYHGGDTSFIAPAMESFGAAATLEFFRSLGLLTTAENSGRVYPLSDQAGSVVDVLRFAASQTGIEIKTGFEVTELKRVGGGFAAVSKDGEIRSDKVIVCCGGMAGGKLGGGKSGYELLKSMGHSVTKLYPALVQIKTDNTFIKSLKGIRADAAVSLCRGCEALSRSVGEVQFTDYGVSGPAIFEVSRAAAVNKGGLILRLDLVRDIEHSQLENLLAHRREQLPNLTVEDVFTGMLHNRLGRTVARYAGYELTTPLTSLTSKDDKRLAAGAKDFSADVIDVLGFDGAQITVGGVKTSEFDENTMESRLISGLYAAGEVLDIDGDCGGYNLQWAWASGRLAGMVR